MTTGADLREQEREGLWEGERGRVTEGDTGAGIDRRDDGQRSRACIYTGYSTAGAIGIIFGLSCHGLGQYIHGDAGAVCMYVDDASDDMLQRTTSVAVGQAVKLS